MLFHCKLASWKPPAISLNFISAFGECVLHLQIEGGNKFRHIKYPLYYAFRSLLNTFLKRTSLREVKKGRKKTKGVSGGKKGVSSCFDSIECRMSYRKEERTRVLMTFFCALSAKHLFEKALRNLVVSVKLSSIIDRDNVCSIMLRLRLQLRLLRLRLRLRRRLL